MDDINQQPGNEQQAPSEPRTGGRLVRFGRRHPALTIAGLAAAGLAGGVEMAAGVVLGAGVIAFLRGRRAQQPVGEPEISQTSETHGLHDLRERARAVVQAAMGDLPPQQAPAT